MVSAAPGVGSVAEVITAPATEAISASPSQQNASNSSFDADSQPPKNSIFTNYAPHIPFSQRRAPPLDLSTVERRGQPSAARETRRVRPHGLQEAPTFRPSEDEFKDPFEYIQRIRPEAEKYGICKIIPPDSWSPEFAINTERFFFKTRRQELNSVEGGTRTNVQYLDQLAKFHKQHGMNLNRFPSVDKRPLDLYKLKKAVECRSGFEKVCKLKKWAEIGRDLGYSGKIMSSLSTSLKNSYQKWLHPYEQYLKVAKPGVQQQLDFENGGPFIPASMKQHLNGSQQGTPTHLRDGSPAIRAPNALNPSLSETPEPDRKLNTAEPAQPIVSSGFIPVNRGGFTPVNAPSGAFSRPSSSGPPKRETENGIYKSPPQRPINGTVPLPSIGDPSFISHLANGHSSNPLKRAWGQDLPSSASGKEGTVGFNTEEYDEQRNKRMKKAPTIVGSHMSQPRPVISRMPSGQQNGKKGEACELCGTKDERSSLLMCDGCESGYHKNCLDPPARVNPLVDWHCPRCLVGTGDFGFEEGGIYSLRQFQDKARYFKETHFEPRMQFDPVTNKKKAVSEDDVEREFWRLVESPSEDVEVEYGADIHSTTHGSGFPTIEKTPSDPYSTDHWNLNILPYHPDSLFKHINSDISGMTIPWLYVGMCFSTFCWHNEDHYCYSANYQHFGATKTWYGIPGADAERFEQAMRDAVPELFESQPDLLFQLVTLLPPDRLRKAGVNVYALDQRAGQFVITFPQAYHAGFNHGFNFNEAVNFAPADWELFGDASIRRLQEFRKQPCFSHDELLMTAAKRDTSIKAAKWLAPALQRLGAREHEQRDHFLKRHKEQSKHRCKIDKSGENADTPCELEFEIRDVDVPEAEYQCVFCKAYSYLSSFHCTSTGKVMCLLHASNVECCEASEGWRYRGAGHVLRFRMSNTALDSLIQRVADRATQPEAWQDRLSKALDEEERPSLKALQTLVNEGEKIPWELPGLEDLKAFVAKCNEWVEEAQNYITRKQQNRRKNEKAWRKSKSAKVEEAEEREKEMRKVENINRLLANAEELCFDCPQITTLRERSEAIGEFRKDARAALTSPNLRTTQELEELAESGKGFNVDVPEVEELEALVRQQRWTEEVAERTRMGGVQFKTLNEINACIHRGLEAGIPHMNVNLHQLRELEKAGQLWEIKVQELLSMDVIHYQQLEALASQSERLPITEETRNKIDAILSKQREAQKLIEAIVRRSADPDIRNRPKYKEARDALEALSELNSKPNGAQELENAVKKQENWMRKGKKLFGKANAPLHILQQHLNYVEEHNSFCFDKTDKPRMPVEPASRENSPADGEEVGVKSEKNVFCMCRQPEAGTMLECELCLEWYHSRCLKIARGKVKEDDKYNCPICDYRVKIPRDAARPKLEELSQWQDELSDLPFQPEEEAVLRRIVTTAQDFRDFLRPHINPMMTNPSEVTTQRFYLRKIEGAEILLSFETNFFRQEVHKWAPVADQPPPILEVSKSTRKPRPTKQQKLMAQHGVSTPEELPLQFRTKSYQPPKSRQGSDTKIQIQPAVNQRPMSSHSVSTDNSPNPRAHEHRVPPPISTAHNDATYAAHYPMPSSHNPHSASESPRFPPSPYYQNGTHVHSPFTHHQSPLSASHPPMEPNMFEADDCTFEHPHARLASTPPPQDSFMNDNTSPQGDAAVARMFDEFVSHPEDDVQQTSEVAQELEARGRENEAEMKTES